MDFKNSRLNFRCKKVVIFLRRLLCKINPCDASIYANPEPPHIEEEIKRFEIQIHRHVEDDTMDSDEYSKLHAARQALSWSVNPHILKSAFNLIVGPVKKSECNFIFEEFERIETAIKRETDKTKKDKLLLAQQVLSWVIDREQSPPHGLIMESH